MTSIRQIEANRRNALKSTGPRSEEGKHRASQNAVRHGLTAETVIELHEDREDYKAFEQAVAADYDPQSAVERELILRLASLLWRLRRATSIETGLLQIEGEILRERRNPPQIQPTSRRSSFTALFRLGERAAHGQSDQAWSNGGSKRDPLEGKFSDSQVSLSDTQSDVARHFLRLANLHNGVFEKLGRYEVALWRQVRQTIFTLEGLRWRSLGVRYPSQHPWRRRTEVPSD